MGFKLAKPALFKQMFAPGWYQFVPFALTIVGILTTDLLVGIGLGMSAAVFFVLLTNYRHPYFVEARRSAGASDPHRALRTRLLPEPRQHTADA